MVAWLPIVVPIVASPIGAITSGVAKITVGAMKNSKENQIQSNQPQYGYCNKPYFFHLRDTNHIYIIWIYSDFINLYYWISNNQHKPSSIVFYNFFNVNEICIKYWIRLVLFYLDFLLFFLISIQLKLLTNDK